ncbi:MAG: NADH-quinone oxidoreductase subunit C [Actinobacteria bacterium]|nr:NADH-quinone oxidoreductase subunit C [Actinomycetota bacterium]
MRASELAERVRARFPEVVAARGEVTVHVDRGRLVDALAWLEAEPDLRFGFLSSLTATDWPGQDPRFWVAYELRSMEHHHRIRVKVGLPEDDPHVPSVTPFFPTANWHEREVFDFFGILFDGHPALTRILLPEGWEGFPLRKDEELGGVGTRYHGAFIPPVDERTTT